MIIFHYKKINSENSLTKIQNFFKNKSVTIQFLSKEIQKTCMNGNEEITAGFF